MFTGEPKIIYAKMMYRPQKTGVQAIRNIFNEALEQKLCHMSDHYIMEVNVRRSGFDRFNNLTASGEHEYWDKLDRTIEDFDIDRIKLNPKPPMTEAESSNNNGGQ